MIYFLYGDIKKAKERAHRILDELFSRKPNASFFKMSEENWDVDGLDEYISSQGLFENKYIVLVDRVFSNKEVKELILKRFAEVASSPNIFIFLEESIDKKTLVKVEKWSEKTQEFKKEKSGPKKEKFNIFSLTDALGRRDKKDLWMLFNKAIFENVSAEEIHGILFWQIKSIFLAKTSSNSKDSGLNPFVYKKSLAFSSNYTLEELKDLSSALLSDYHESRRGFGDLAVSVERLILDI